MPRGVTDIVAVDLSEERLSRARLPGARATINAGSTDVAQALGREHGTGGLYGIPVVQSGVFIEAAGVARAPWGVTPMRLAGIL